MKSFSEGDLFQPAETCRAAPWSWVSDSKADESFKLPPRFLAEGL